MPALGAYRALLRACGPQVLVLSFLARLPNAMGPLGVLSLVVATTRSYAAAGAAAGALGLGAALGGPGVGALADRYGQRLVGGVAAVVDALAYAGLVVAATGHAPAWAVVGCAALAGLLTPQVGPFMRVRWVTLLGERGLTRLVPTAFSYEGAVDEVSFVAGPALVGVFALVFPPAVPLLVAAGLLVVAGLTFAVHPSAPPALRAPGEPDRPARLPRLAVAGLVLAMAAMGVVFGGTQTAVTALAESAGRPGEAGLIYALLGIGSATAGLATAWLPGHFRWPARYLTFSATLAIGVVALLAVGSTASAAAVMAVLGLVCAPYLITVYGLAERVAPPGRAGVVMTLMASGIVAGVAAGSGVAGLVADAYGFRGAFGVPIAGGVGALVLALVTVRRLRIRLAVRRDRSAAPAYTAV
ncbi:MAG TPA: MFS transporter [Actinocatenispora sp.]